MAAPYDVIVIGAGLNGLTAAAYLAKAGRRVLVLEQRTQPGGSAVTEELAPGFSFDPCTSDPGWISPTLLRDLNLARHGLELLPPDPALVGLAPDADPLVLMRDPQRAATAIEKFSRADAKHWPVFAQRMHKLAGFLGLLYNAAPPRPIGGGLNELVNLALLGRKLRGLGKADMIELLRVLPMSIDELLGDEFESELLKATIGAGGVAGLQQGPRSAGTTFLLLHHLVGAEAGAFRLRQRVRGGLGSLAGALANAARAAGAELRYSARVQQIRVAHGKSSGVVLASGDELAAARVLSTIDVNTTLLQLAGPAHLDPELVRTVRNVRARGVIARVHLALAELPRFTRSPGDEGLRGVISIAPTLDFIEHAYDNAKHGAVSAQPVLELTIPSLADASLAPTGQHVLSVSMQYAPFALREGTWDSARREALGDAVVQRIAEFAPNLPGAVLNRSVLTPADLQSRYALPEGNVDHGELGLDQILFMRPLPGWSRNDSPIGGLYLGGAGSHPGRAIAGGAGRLAAQTILNNKS